MNEIAFLSVEKPQKTKRGRLLRATSYYTCKNDSKNGSFSTFKPCFAEYQKKAGFSLLQDKKVSRLLNFSFCVAYKQ
jgi:hypothetical protein